MQVNALDHVNIITDRLDETADFYVRLLELERRDGPPPLPAGQVQWLHDASGRPIVHLNSVDCPRAFDRAVEPGALTGAIHHVALNCSGFADVITRLDALAAEYRVNTIASIGLRQVFTADPNNVLLELNFWGD